MTRATGRSPSPRKVRQRARGAVTHDLPPRYGDAYNDSPSLKENVMENAAKTTANIGVVGLAVMGSNLASRRGP